MSETKKSLIGKGPAVIKHIVDEGSFQENVAGEHIFDSGLGVGAVVGTGLICGKNATIITNNSTATSKRFPVVYLGIIGLEEAYKMAMAVYYTIKADSDKPAKEKRPIILLVDTPGNAPGKVEEIVGINKATGSYQLALSEARKTGHPVIAVIIGRAISGGFLCHGLQADRILSIGEDYTTMIHVMPLSSISRITKLDVERLEELSRDNPVFASGAKFFYKLGGVEEMINSAEDIRGAIINTAKEIYKLKADGEYNKIGPMSRGALGEQRGGRKIRGEIIRQMETEFDKVSYRYLK